jgi:1-acyl-sn-glycerol-3-phosphate acyltransferase
VNIFQAALVPRRAEARNAAPGEAIASARKVIDHLVEAMGEQYSLIIFPEGTRGSGDEVGPFKSGLYHLCQRKPGLPLVPAYLNNLNRILPKGEFLPVPFISQLTFGPAIMLQPDEPKALFLARAREAVCHLKEI